jgi:hypothetical protein
MKSAAPAQRKVKTSFILTVETQLSGRFREGHSTTTGIKMG